MFCGTKELYDSDENPYEQEFREMIEAAEKEFECVPNVYDPDDVL